MHCSHAASYKTQVEHLRSVVANEQLFRFVFFVRFYLWRVGGRASIYTCAMRVETGRALAFHS